MKPKLLNARLSGRIQNLANGNIPINTKVQIELKDNRYVCTCPYCDRERRITKNQLDLIETFGLCQLRCGCQWHLKHKKVFTIYK